MLFRESALANEEKYAIPTADNFKFQQSSAATYSEILL